MSENKPLKLAGIAIFNDWRSPFGNFKAFLSLSLPLALIYGFVLAFVFPHRQSVNFYTLALFTFMVAIFAINWMRLCCEGPRMVVTPFTIVKEIITNPLRFISSILFYFIMYFVNCIGFAILFFGLYYLLLFFNVFSPYSFEGAVFLYVILMTSGPIGNLISLCLCSIFIAIIPCVRDIAMSLAKEMPHADNLSRSHPYYRISKRDGRYLGGCLFIITAPAVAALVILKANIRIFYAYKLHAFGLVDHTPHLVSVQIVSFAVQFFQALLPLAVVAMFLSYLARAYEHTITLND